ncbi:MAG: hypothetical protein O9292_08765 [Rhodobacteraceae bacterium]|nr:hypothetical protein [Paracoccaceae bacterium]MCZ8334891.1 hypothetical protein [Paracoccaceae bacterium]
MQQSAIWLLVVLISVISTQIITSALLVIDVDSVIVKPNVAD